MKKISAVLLCCFVLSLFSTDAMAEEATEAVDIGSRLELFVDDFLVDTLSGNARRRLHHPQPREIIMEFGTEGKPWEAGYGGSYPALVRDGERILIYHRASPGRPARGQGSQLATVIESEDGINFHRPNVGLHEFRGCRENNIVWPGQLAGHHFTPFLDSRPGVPEDERFKAFARAPGGMGFYASPDGYDWRLMDIEPKNMAGGPTDSQNITFWDPLREHYVAYLRAFRVNSGLLPPEVDFSARDQEGNRHGYHRCIRRAVSDDLVNWAENEFIEYEDDRQEHLYTNGIQPYYRAPHIFIGLPNRMVTGRRKVARHPFSGINDVVLMSSRDGRVFQRWPEAFLGPDTDPENWTERNHYPALGMVQTSPTEISLYWNEHNRHQAKRLRRGTIRVDGFASVHAGATGGQLLTRPLVFSGNRLLVNYQTSAAGRLRFELADEAGEPIPGFSLAESETLFGNAIEHMVSWRGNTDLSGLAGQPVRLRVELADADLYSIRFEPAGEIAARLAQTADRARERLADPLPAFAGRCRGEMESAFSRLEAELSDNPDPGPGALEAGFLLERALARYRECERVERRAGEALEAAAGVEVEEGFGRMYHDALVIAREEMEEALNRDDSSVERARESTGGLEGALANLDKARSLRDEAGKTLEKAHLPEENATDGFGRLYREKITRRAGNLAEQLSNPRATAGSVRSLVRELENILADYLSLDDFAPVRPREVAGRPAAVTLTGPEEWETGQRFNLSAEKDLGLTLDFTPEVFFPAGNRGYVECPAGDHLKTPAVTVEARVRVDDTGGRFCPIVMLGGRMDESLDADRKAWHLRVHFSTVNFSLGRADSGHAIYLRQGRLEAGQWHHVAAVFDGREARVYIDGQLAGSEQYEGPIFHEHSRAVRIGGHDGRDDWFEGAVRDVRIWDRARTEEEIRESMGRELAGDEDGLAGYWLAGPGAGDGETVFDLSGHEGHGRIVGASWKTERGYRISDPFSFPGIEIVTGSSIEWIADRDGQEGAALQIMAGLSESADSLPGQWYPLVNGGSLVEPGMDLRGRFLWLKQAFAASDPATRPVLEEIRLELK